MVRGRVGRAALVLAALGVGLAGCSEDRTDGASSSTTATPASVACAEDLVTCARATSVGDVIPDRPGPANGEPIVVGMINQEGTPFGSYPELSSAAQAGIDFVNEELGGVGGRPIELDVCRMDFSPEGSTACAQRFVQERVPVVLGGIDVFGTGIDTLAENGVPFVGGIPVSTQSVTSPTSFQWSGGSWGATIAFAEHAANDLGARRVAIVYGEFGPITSSAEHGRAVLTSLGVEDVQMVPYPVTSTDLGAPLQAAATGEPDAVIVLAADAGCRGAFDGVEATEITAQLYYVGACAAPEIIAAAGPAKTDGAIFNVENPVDPDAPNPDFDLYRGVAAVHGDGFDPIGAGTVTFRSLMNLYRVLVGIDGEITPTAITEALRAQDDAPSFMGHPSTCDGEQLEGLPALCSPQQILAVMESGQLAPLGDWVDVGAVYAGR